MNTLEIQWVDGTELKHASWRANYVLQPDLRVLYNSMKDFGWLQPIVVQKSNNTIIDGHYRWEIAGSLKTFEKKYKSLVPVVYEDCSDIEAMLLHIRMNRGRGSLAGRQMARIIRSAKMSKKFSDKDFKRILAMHYDEIDIMVDGTLLKSRNIKDHKYSNAWIPVEAPADTVDTASIIERPPNPDR